VDEIQRNRSWSSKAVENNTTFKILDIKILKNLVRKKSCLHSVLRIRIRMFLDLLDPDPDPSIITQKNKKNLDPYCFVTSL
jgi:hypothetical protein